MAQINSQGDSKTQPFATVFSSGGKGKRTHFLVTVQELGVRLGGSLTVRREVLVDIGNAKNFAMAEERAKVRVARTLGTNIICLRVSANQVRSS